MMRINRYLRMEITAAEPAYIMTKLIEAGIKLLNVSRVDDLTFDATIQNSEWIYVEEILLQLGASVKILHKEGKLWWIQSIIRRPVLMLGILIIFGMACALSNRVLSIRVIGNEIIPERMILSSAQNNGVKFGIKTSNIRSENVKNKMLSDLPQLQWIGVEIKGSTVTIVVQERSDNDHPFRDKKANGSLIASQSGIISKMTVYSGNPMCKVGDAVDKGSVLVSCYSNSDRKTTIVPANAEIFAYTNHTKQILSLFATAKREEILDKQICYKLRIGKKVINLCNHSGISDGSCVKMYSEDYWVLSDSFQLPVSLIAVETTRYRTTAAQKPDPERFEWLSEFAHAELRSQMVAGEILRESVSLEMLDKTCLLTGEYACNEMIGQVKYEEIIERNAEDN